MKLLLNTVLVLSVCMLFQACDLDLQRSYDFDEDDHWPAIEPYDVTMWDYMTNEGEYDQNSELDSMVVAVKRAGMENIYNEENDNKTVFLLRNKAMKEFLDDQGYGSVGEVPVNTLKNLLKYHVVTTRLIQTDLPILDWKTFQTLAEDSSDGRISLMTYNWYWNIHINENDAPNMPSTAKSGVVYLHNFEFTTGIAHQLNTYVRRVPF